MRRGSRIPTILNYSFFVLMAILMLYPIWYVLMYSLSDPAKESLNNYYLIPDGFTLQTYLYVLKLPHIIIGYKNTIFVTVAGTAISLFLTVITAYPFSKKDLIGKKYFFGMMLVTMLFYGGVIPTYMVVRSLGLTDTLWALIIPNALSVFNILVMVKFFKGIPESLIESAKIDGYNDISILIKIVLPLSTAVLASIGLFYAVGRWNEYLSCALYITSREKKVLQVILRGMLTEDSLGAQTGQLGLTTTPHVLRMAAIIITLVPILCVYPVIQKHFMKGLLIGAVKG